MISAIVYNSNAGHTKEYAVMLSESINLPIFTIEDAKELLPKNSEIIFLSWVKNSKLMKYSQVKKMYNIKMIGAVGIDDYDNKETVQRFVASNNIQTEKLFFLRGGVSLDKLSIKSRSYFTMLARKLKEYILKRGYGSADDYEKVEMLEKGGSYVMKNNLKDLIINYKSEPFNI